MIYAVVGVLGAYWLCLIVWTYYLAVMQLKAARDAGELENWFIRMSAVVLLICGVGFYAALNLILATIVFLDLPREFEFTKRCQRYIRHGSGWRYKAAKWICKHALDPFEYGGHC